IPETLTSKRVSVIFFDHKWIRAGSMSRSGLSFFLEKPTMNTSDLTNFGWDEFSESAFQPYAANGYACGRVALEYKDCYRIYSEWGEVRGEIAGRLRHEALDRGELPVVGDWVVIRPHPESGKVTID